MLKKIANLGKTLEKTEQKVINGGFSNNFVAKCCHTVFGCTFSSTNAATNILQKQGYFCIAIPALGSL
ncbi:hypothetical protein BA195_07525 [Tenacibaculum soleae]|uniref:Uncharacterized protein n=1 Tax=Tenacibaculum soleae TaxID=447689 RepID=A0A1B9XYX7_9FLAO|nr:hypothetical protein BA195_07525 [Tenacibaculum soleae]